MGFNALSRSKKDQNMVDTQYLMTNNVLVKKLQTGMRYLNQFTKFIDFTSEEVPSWSTYQIFCLWLWSLILQVRPQVFTASSLFLFLWILLFLSALSLHGRVCCLQTRIWLWPFPHLCHCPRRSCCSEALHMESFLMEEDSSPLRTEGRGCRRRGEEVPAPTQIRGNLQLLSSCSSARLVCSDLVF